MAVYSNGGFTTPDIWLVISLLLTASVSCVLNPIVFRHNLKKKRSLPRDLYLALSATDFVSSIVLTSFFSYGILQPKEVSCLSDPRFNQSICENAYYAYYRPAKVWEKVMSILIWWLFFTPASLTTMISLSRWYSIKYPFRTLNRNKIEVLTAVFQFLILAYYSVFIMNKSPQTKTLMLMSIQLAFNSASFGHLDFELIDETVGLTATILATVASIMTIHHVSRTSEVPRSNEQPGKRLRSAVKVALLNAGSTLLMLLTMGRVIMNQQNLRKTYLFQVYHTIFVNVLPVFISSYNAVVYVLFSRSSIFNRGQNIVQVMQ